MKYTRNILFFFFFASSLLMGEEIPNSVIAEGTLFSIYKVDSFSELESLPTFSLGAPPGFAAESGVIFAGVGGRKAPGFIDGAFAMGMGFGDPVNYLGGSATLAIGSIDPRDGGSWNRGDLNLSLGRNFESSEMGISVGVSDIQLWLPNSSDSHDPSFYLSTTKVFLSSSKPLILTAGLGNNMYSDVRSRGDLRKKIGAFGSAAFYPIPQLSIIADYTAGTTSAGLGLAPFPKLPVTFYVGAFDIFQYTKQGKTSFIAGISGTYKF